MDFLVEYLPLQWWLATVFQAGDPGTAVMKIDPKQMSVNNEAEANLWLEQTLNENLTRASCHLDIDQRASSHPSPLLHLPLHNETLQPGNQGDSRYYNYIAPPLPFWRFFLFHWMQKPLATFTNYDNFGWIDQHYIEAPCCFPDSGVFWQKYMGSRAGDGYLNFWHKICVKLHQNWKIFWLTWTLPGYCVWRFWDVWQVVRHCWANWPAKPNYPSQVSPHHQLFVWL